VVNPAYGAYAALSSALFVSGFPLYYLCSRFSGHPFPPLPQRLGVYDTGVRHLAGSPRIWIHAVSVGEVNVAGALIGALKRMWPACGIVLSTSTCHGQAAARRLRTEGLRCVYAPLDFLLSVQNALAAVSPDVLVCLETEIWPNWLVTARKMGIRTALVNGRLSERSIRRYLWVRPLMAEALRHVEAFSMIHGDDARRIRQLGAPPERVTIGGNAKYDLLPATVDAATAEKMGALYRVTPGQPVWVAGSVRRDEAPLVLEVFKRIVARLPGALLIVAPRHLNRVPGIRARAQALGLSCQLRTEMDEAGRGRTAQVVVVDTMGELQATYSVATAVFCGASLVPLGGQNVLEAAVWGKPVLYGPFMDDFREARDLLDGAGGGIGVADAAELTERLLALLSAPQLAADLGDRARQAVLSLAGAGERHAAVILDLLNRDSGRAV
jgi:3-deoxy-D-manno-octulosonic-acid transferase